MSTHSILTLVLLLAVTTLPIFTTEQKEKVRDWEDDEVAVVVIDDDSVD